MGDVMGGTITIDGKVYPIKPGSLRIDLPAPQLAPYQREWLRGLRLPDRMRIELGGLMTWRRVRKSKGYRRHVRRMKAKGNRR